MTRKTFGWFPNAEHRKAVTPPVFSTKFGDGFEQRAPIGITPILDTWDLSFTGTRAEVSAIEAFLLEHRGASSFYWKNPDEKLGTYVARSWDKSRQPGISTLSVQFEQVPEL